MSLPPEWIYVPFRELENHSVCLKWRYEVSQPLHQISLFELQSFEKVVRDGLGEWIMIALKSRAGRHLLFGSPSHESTGVGTSVWTDLDIPLHEITHLLRVIANDEDILVLEAESSAHYLY